MTFRIERTVKARGDLLDIWLSIAVDNIEAADRQLRKIDNAIESLVDYPRSGRLREDILPDARAILRMPHLIFYRVDEENQIIQVIRIIDGRRDIGKLLTS